MTDPLALLGAGREIDLHLVGGVRLEGHVLMCGNGWLQLATAQGGVLVNLAQVVAIGMEGTGSVPTPVTSVGGLPKPSSKDRPRMAGGTAPGRPWRDEDLKQLADSYLDGELDADLAARYHRTRGQIKEMRQGFECARGNLVDDQIGDVARTWVERWRRVLS